MSKLPLDRGGHVDTVNRGQLALFGYTDFWGLRGWGVSILFSSVARQMQRRGTGDTRLRHGGLD